MNKVAILFSLLFIISCKKSPDFLAVVIPPPPAPVAPVPPAAQKIDRTYKLDTSYSTTGSADVDIIWVIDNSSSMAPSQALVRANTSAFIEQFTKATAIHWQMGLLSTTEYQQPFEGFDSNNLLNFKLTQAQAVTRFQNAVSVLGQAGSDTELTFTPVLNAIKQHPSFLREGAYLALIFVTDEPEQSPISADSFIAQLTALKAGDSSKLLSYGIFKFQDLGCEDEYYYSGSHFDTFIQKTKGRLFKLCSEDFGKLLSQLGADLVSKTQSLSGRVLLTDRPVVKTIEVFLTGQKLVAGTQWVYDPINNVVVITDASLLKSRDALVRVVFEPAAQHLGE